MGQARAAQEQAPAATDVAAWRPRAASPVTATVLGVLTMVVLAVAVALSGLEHQLSILGTGPVVPVVVAYVGVGVIVARRQPRNPIGWILLVFILLFVFSSAAGLYAVLYYRHGYHGLPLAPAAVLLQPLWAPALLLFPVVILLFPDGRLASRRWRWVLWGYAVIGACVCVAVFGPAVAAVAGHHIRLDSSGDVTSKARAPGGLAAVVWVLGLLAIAATVLSFVAHQVLSWRRATGERRQQLKWLASGAAVTVIVGIASFGVSSASAGGEVLGIGLAALPVGIGIGILKYRLYEIDRLISRTLAYTIVTGLLVGVYAGLVLLATHVLPFSTPVAVAGSTLAAAALFNPLRRGVQRAVDRRFNRSRYDADAAVAAFAARLKDAVDLDTARAELAGAVHRSLEPAHVWVWIRQYE